MRYFVIIFALFLSLLPIHVLSEATTEVKVHKTNLAEKSININELNKLIDDLNNANEQLYVYQSDVYKIQLEYYKKYHAYLAQKIDINLKNFLWQQRASEFILWLVIIVVLAGILFSGYQLWRASTLSSSLSDSTIELAVHRIKITSSIVGVVVLAISIVFLYLFLIEVYRIKLVDLSSVEVKPTISTQ